uniref:Uncharacterized protein n=1 Tax=Trichuris muris TaxID=70415 RepID=A0A5S6R038_TRIMR
MGERFAGFICFERSANADRTKADQKGESTVFQHKIRCSQRKFCAEAVSISTHAMPRLHQGWQWDDIGELWLHNIVHVALRIFCEPLSQK